MPTQKATKAPLLLELTCEACKKRVSKVEDTKDGKLCDSCVTECAWCSEMCDSDLTSETDHGHVCEGCYNRCYECQSCGGMFHRESYSWARGRNDMCEECSENDEQENQLPTRDWKHDERVINGVPGKIMQGVRLFGLECEMGYPNTQAVHDVKEHINKFIGITEDSGAEFQTPPASGDKAEAMIENMCRHFRDKGLSVRDGQGLHVHIDCHELEAMPPEARFKRIQDLWLFYIVFDKTIRSFTNQYRQGRAESDSMYGKNIYKYSTVANAKSEAELERIWYACSDQNQIDNRKGQQKDGTRYKGFNLHALFHEFHLEIRYHESCMSAAAMLEWANLHALIMDKAIAGMDREWLDRMNQRVIKRKAMFEYIGLSENSRQYFNSKTRKCAA